jgi:hypothetical protein
MAVLPVLALAQPDLSQTKYVAVDISWDPNPTSENVGWYMLEWNDEGLADNTWSVLRNESATAVYIPFTELVAKASRAAPKPAIKLTDELCVRVVAAREGDRSNPSAPACFTMLHDTNEPPDPDDPPAVLSAPANVTVEHRP